MGPFQQNYTMGFKTKYCIIESQSDETDFLGFFWQLVVWCINIEKNRVLSPNKFFSTSNYRFGQKERVSVNDMQILQPTYKNFTPSISCAHIDWYHKSPSGTNAIAIDRMKKILMRSTQDTLFNFHTIDKYAGLELMLLILNKNS